MSAFHPLQTLATYVCFRPERTLAAGGYSEPHNGGRYEECPQEFRSQPIPKSLHSQTTDAN